MAKGIDLRPTLVAILGSEAVYYQPPNGVQMTYPCIVYQLSDVDTKYANNVPYGNEKTYLLTVMEKIPDSPIVEKVLALPKCGFDRNFIADNLYHTVFTIVF